MYYFVCNHTQLYDMVFFIFTEKRLYKMPEKRVRKSITIFKNVEDNVQKIADNNFGGNFSLAVENLLSSALDNDRKLTEEKNINRYILMKIFYYLRENFRARDDDILDDMDKNFLKICEKMREELIEEGVDYGSF